MRRLGIADLGSNSARLLVFAYQPGSWFRIADGISETTRLGEGLAASGRLSAPAMRRALAAVALFSDYARAAELDELEILGTSAIRDAGNREDLLRRVEGLGHRVVVLSGEEEAALGVSAVANGFDLGDAWVLDLGGGSVQLSRMQRRRWAEGGAYPLGSVRLTEAFLRTDRPAPTEVRALEEAVEEQLGPALASLDPSQLLVAIGGTVRSLARMAQKRDDYPLPLLHGYRLGRAALEAIVEDLLAVPQAERSRLPGLNPERADIIVAGALVFRWVMRRTGLDSLLVSGHGVREGAFFRRFLAHPHLLSDVRRFSVRNRARQYPQPATHVRQVRHLARELFDGLARLHGLDATDRELLDAAATLHDSGTVLDYYRHHRHGEYLLTSAPLDGFTHRELILVALLVRYHRKGKPRLGPYRRLAGDGDKRRLAQLATCLRLAESLERSRAGRVRSLEVGVGPKTVRVTLRSTEEPTVELWEAQRHGAAFRSAFGRRLDFAVAPAGEA